MRRIASTSFIVLLASAGAFACSSSKDSGPAWACADVAVPNGTTVECVAHTSSALGDPLLDIPYQCNVYGDYNPNCPPPGTGSDGGTGDYNPDGGGTPGTPGTDG